MATGTALFSAASWRPLSRYRTPTNASAPPPKATGLARTWTAQPKQAQLLSATEDQVFYGGAKGGGKTDALLMYGYRACRQPHARVLLLRRTFADLSLPGAAIDRSHELFQGLAVWNGTQYRWTFPNGARLQFGHLQDQKARYKYQGAQVDAVLWDELTQIEQADFDYVWASVRSPRGYRAAFRATGNPGGVGHQWVKRRFVDAAPAGEPFAAVNDAGEPWGTARFIPAKLEDNPALTTADPTYKDRLAALPDALRRALLEGDWDVFQGQVFAAWRRETHVVVARALPPDWPRVVGLDYGTHRPFAAVWLARGARLDDDPPPEGPCDRQAGHIYAYRDVVKAGLTDEAMAHVVALYSQGERIGQYLADPASFFLKNNQTGQSPAALFLAGGVRLVPANNDRIAGKRALETAIGRCACGVPRLRAMDRCVELIRAIPSLPYDPVNVEDVDTRAEGDDIYDAIRYGLMGGRPKPDKPYATSSMSGQHAYE
jgi:phage terminase large subunit